MTAVQFATFLTFIAFFHALSVLAVACMVYRACRDIRESEIAIRQQIVEMQENWEERLKND